MTTTPQAALLTDDEVAQRINLARTNLFDRAGTTSFRIARSIEQAILAKLQATQEPVQAGELPTPFGYVSDGFPDGLHFQHKPWPEMHMLLNSVAQVYSAAQMRAALSARKPLAPLTPAQMEKGRDQIFSINNPFCPCDSKTFSKVAEWVERHHGIGLEVKP